MRKKKILILFLTLICLAALCVGVAACEVENLIDTYLEEGYIVTVTYDPNGGVFNTGTEVWFMYNPDNYPEEEDGTKHIKIEKLTDTLRDESGTAQVTNISRNNYSFWGWYQTRTIAPDDDGNIVDDYGEVLIEDEDAEGTYHYRDDPDATGVPRYTYSDPWDFDNDYIVYDGEDRISLTLYAAWVPYFEYDFYYQDNGVWTKYGSTSFNYASYLENLNYSNRVYIPRYPEEGGKMNYTRSSSSGDAVTFSYTFPSLSGYTFRSAYYYDVDGSLTYIDDFAAHYGTVDDATATATNFIMNIYVEFDKGTIYLIKTAQQFIDNSDLEGYFKIDDDLDFTGLTWPSRYDLNTFSGQIYSSEEGVARKMENITVSHQNSSSTVGGMFGVIGGDAVIRDIEFSNVTFDFAALGRTVNNGYFALFAGDIEKGATFDNVKLSGNLVFRIGSLSTEPRGNNINILSNGDMTGIDRSEATLYVVCYSSGTSTRGFYRYNVIVSTVEVDDDLNISYSLSSSASDSYNGVDYTESEYIVYPYKSLTVD